MRKLLILLGLVVLAAGCTGNRDEPERVNPFEHKYPKKVEWDDPAQVLKSFYGAKKTGDWKMAFEICDFTEVLPRADAKKIKQAWKKDSVNWVQRYKYHDWYAVEKSREGDKAVVAVTEFHSISDPRKLAAQSDYSEEMKLYGKKWRLVAGLELQALENETDED